MQDKKNNFYNTTTFRLCTVGFLILVFFIPIEMLQNLIEERQDRKESVQTALHKTWSKKQILRGPILTIPYKEYYWDNTIKQDENNHEFKTKTLQYKTMYIHLLPETLSINGELFPEIRYRGIYEVVVYKSYLNIMGSYNTLDLEELDIDAKNLMYDKAFISFGVGDLRGIKSNIEVDFNKQKVLFSSGVKKSSLSNIINNAMSTSVYLDKEILNYDFSFDLELNGSDTILFLPYGKETNITMKSNWGNPSFVGDFLPSNRKVGESSFTANWSVLNMNRSYPQIYKDNDISQLNHKEISTNQQNYYNRTVYSKKHTDYLDSSFGVTLKIPVDFYQKSMRSTKYAFLFIILTFLIFFFTEVFNKIKIHPFQYIIVGLSLVLFFSLLLSFSEHIGFDLSYIGASFATTLSISLYVRTIFKNDKVTLSFALFLLFLYTFIYILLQLQDFALLIGSSMLFVLLGSMMYISRKINWYENK